MKYYLGIIVVIFSFLVSCSIEPKPINYGTDPCDFCKMIIVDKYHSAEILTKKGKTYKFDAIECMVNYRKDFDKNKVKMYLINPFDNPTEFNRVEESVFLISQDLPSPMGAFLTGFSKSKSDSIKQNSEGQLFLWEELVTHLNK